MLLRALLLAPFKFVVSPIHVSTPGQRKRPFRLSSSEPVEIVEREASKLKMVCLASSSSAVLRNWNFNANRLSFSRRTNLSRWRSRSGRTLISATSTAPNTDNLTSPTRLVTFLGKGGSGKTTSAVFAAQVYAMAGLRTCLVIQGQDTTADYLLNHKISSSPVECNSNLLVVRLETTKMILEPLNWLKKADARINMTQGVLEEVVGEELGVLPGMDPISSAIALEGFVGLLGNLVQRKQQHDQFDIIIYDGASPEETLRMVGACSKARLYLKYMRSLAEKTDIGRLVAPSVLRLVDESVNISTGRSLLNAKLSGEIWDDLDRILERGSSAFLNPNKFACFVVMDPSSPTSLGSASRYWGSAVQAGTQISGAFGISFPKPTATMETVMKKFSPVPFKLIPHISVVPPPDWKEVVQSNTSEGARGHLLAVASQSNHLIPAVKFDKASKSVTLLMPGFEKSEIKLYQYRGGSELLVEAGDQRRVIHLPPEIQGKVAGAKFMDQKVVVRMR